MTVKKTFLKKFNVSFFSLAMALAMVGTGDSSQAATTYTRVSGANRYETSIKASEYAN